MLFGSALATGICSDIPFSWTRVTVALGEEDRELGAISGDCCWRWREVRREGVSGSGLDCPMESRVSSQFLIKIILKTWHGRPYNPLPKSLSLSRSCKIIPISWDTIKLVKHHIFYRVSINTWERGWGWSSTSSSAGSCVLPVYGSIIFPKN